MKDPLIVGLGIIPASATGGVLLHAFSTDREAAARAVYDEAVPATGGGGELPTIAKEEDRR